jgi:hypothetical protein
MSFENITLCEQTTLSIVVAKMMMQMIATWALDWTTIAFLDKTREQRV